MNIIRDVAFLEQQQFSTSLAASIKSHEEASNSPVARFPSTFKQKVTPIGNVLPANSNSKDDPEEIDLTSIATIDTLAEKTNHKFLSDYGYYAEARALRGCSSTGFTSKCINNHKHAVPTSCGKFWCSWCGLINSHIHKRKVERAFEKVIAPVIQKDFVSSYIVTTVGKELNHWLTFSTTDKKSQKKRLKDHRKLINKGIVQYYQDIKGGDSIFDLSCSSYHFFGEEYIDAKSYIDSINRGKKLKAVKESKDLETVIYFDDNDLNRMVENNEIQSIVEKWEDQEGNIKSTRKYLSPTAYDLKIHTNNFFLHKKKGDAYLPDTEGLRTYLTEIVKEDLIRQKNKGISVSDEVIESVSINFHKQYYGRDRIAQLKHSLNYSLRPTIGASRFSNLTEAKKHYLLNVLKGFHNTVYFGEISTRNFSAFAETIGLELQDKQECTCTVCDETLVVDMRLSTKGSLRTDGREVIDTRESRLYPKRIGAGIYKTIEVSNNTNVFAEDIKPDLEMPNVDDSIMYMENPKQASLVEIAKAFMKSKDLEKRQPTATQEIITEEQDPSLKFDEQTYLDVEQLRPVLDDDGNLISFKYRKSNWKLHKDHMWEKLSNDIDKILHLSVMNRMTTMIPLITKLHLEFLLEVKAKISLEDVDHIALLDKVA